MIIEISISLTGKHSLFEDGIKNLNHRFYHSIPSVPEVADTQTFISKPRGDFWNSLIKGAILIASGLVAKKKSIFTLLLH